jgi:hypothetical protein
MRGFRIVPPTWMASRVKNTIWTFDLVVEDTAPMMVKL